MFVQENLHQRWYQLENKLTDKFGKKPDIETILFLIGLQETGFQTNKISKEQKQDLMHVAVCILLQPSGYFVFEKFDSDNYPHFKQLKEVPDYLSSEHEDFFKEHILHYFDKIEF
ncbi:MAG: hypothetical protein KF781_03970 [Chitinophagaceae bacterium]|nr:hypothetical protein [Chitinophagaceae bacterium]MCW5904757.1 hypothetical protein [Chitinophagaceae bacterium]